MEDLQYTTYISPDAPLLTTLTYMDGKKHLWTEQDFYNTENTPHLQMPIHTNSEKLCIVCMAAR